MSRPRALACATRAALPKRLSPADIRLVAPKASRELLLSASSCCGSWLERGRLALRDVPLECCCEVFGPRGRKAHPPQIVISMCTFSKTWWRGLCLTWRLAPPSFAPTRSVSTQPCCKLGPLATFDAPPSMKCCPCHVFIHEICSKASPREPVLALLVVTQLPHTECAVCLHERMEPARQGALPNLASCV